MQAGIAATQEDRIVMLQDEALKASFDAGVGRISVTDPDHEAVAECLTKINKVTTFRPGRFFLAGKDELIRAQSELLEILYRKILKKGLEHPDCLAASKAFKDLYDYIDETGAYE